MKTETVSIEIPEKFSRIGIMMSGGLDSTLVAALFAKKIHQTNRDCIIVPVTWKRPYNTPDGVPLQWNLTYSKRVIEYIKDMVYDCFDTQYIFEPQNKNKLSAEEEKIERTRLETDISVNELKLDRLYYGTTANPPRDEMKRYGFFDDREKHRDKELDQTRKLKFNPFACVDKKFVKFLYHRNDWMDLAYLTRSCEGYASSTENFTKPCKNCWWCKEKFWGFEFY